MGRAVKKALDRVQRLLSKKDRSRSRSWDTHGGFFTSVEQKHFVQEAELIAFEGNPPVVDAKPAKQLVSCTECKAGSCTRFCGLGKSEIFDQVKNESATASPELAARVDSDTLRDIRLADLVGASDPEDVGGFVDALELWKDEAFTGLHVSLPVLKAMTKTASLEAFGGKACTNLYRAT